MLATEKSNTIAKNHFKIHALTVCEQTLVSNELIRILT